MRFALKFTNPYGEVYWFQGLGNVWSHAPERRLISRTTAKRSEARVFDSEEEARDVLVKADADTGWTIERFDNTPTP